MENKKTIELLTMLENLKESDWDTGGLYEQITEELTHREPFASIFNKDYEESLPDLARRIEKLEETVKQLKRHKHDQTSGDVLVRI
jgi:predicted AlkP superfamily phosphohydrolase/phosphomutase